jgi:predicted metal-binding membrane protein
VSSIESVARRERAVVAVALAVLTLLAWAYIWRGAGMGMTALQMTSVALFPHTQPETMLGMQMPPITWLTVVAMWWIMMIAMMTPSVTPLLLLYARALRHSRESGRGDAVRGASIAALAAGYLGIWLVFSIAAATVQLLLQRAALISDMMLWSRSGLLSAVVLAAAGVYQWSAAKRVCLSRCRSPFELLTRYWRPGAVGSFAMGARHGVWCVGCCWTLMALLFVGGVMNVVWIALLALLVLVERTAPFGLAASKFAGGLLIVWSIATLALWGSTFFSQ